eukprot:TRINITY_DN13867_c0_g1_i5.p1 TRINITY_DN13867_c0_g1~~TRINITY_DN13867_c0_g1_i5.p1  ORF type:complete len:255 (+),score=30.74 TRINITY_DN13867_c0_g1_i5:393-1157(+)
MLDTTLENIRKTQALDVIIQKLGEAEGMYSESEQGMAEARSLAVNLRTRVCNDQREILSDLNMLRFACCAGRGFPEGLEAVPSKDSEYEGSQTEKNTTRATSSSTSSSSPVPEMVINRRPKFHREISLSANLQALANEDSSCLLIIRGITKLGFQAPLLIKRYFEEYGTVARIYLAHSSFPKDAPGEARVRHRPSNMGFLQMKTANAVARILARGETQVVHGVEIRVQQFESHRRFTQEAQPPGNFGGDAARGV